MRRESAKARKRREEARPVRTALLARHRRCMICGRSPVDPWRGLPRECSELCVHEIANGPHRQKALDKPYALLVLCWHCNAEAVEDKRQWPEARQLALLRALAPEDYDLVAYNALVNPRAPNRITEEEVSAWIFRVVGSRSGPRAIPGAPGAVREICPNGGSE